MNGVLGHLCAHIGWTGPGEYPGDYEMTLPSRHRIWNSWRSEDEHATSRSRRLPAILNKGLDSNLILKTLTHIVSPRLFGPSVFNFWGRNHMAILHPLWFRLEVVYGLPQLRYVVWTKANIALQSQKAVDTAFWPRTVEQWLVLY